MAPITQGTVNWTEGIEAEFIDLIKGKRNLWDPQHKSYINTRLKQCAYKDIEKSLRSKWPEHAQLFTLNNLSAQFSSLKSQYKRELKNKKDGKNDEEGKSTSEWNHYQRLSFLESIINKESEQPDSVDSMSLNNSEKTSQTHEMSESPLIDNVTVKIEQDDDYQTESSSVLPNSSASPSTNVVIPTKEVGLEKNTHETNRLDSRLSQGTFCSSPHCKLLYVKALETVKEVVNRTNSTLCACSSNADAGFGRYIGSVLASISNLQKKEALKQKLMEVLSKAKCTEISGKYTVVEVESKIHLVPTCWLTEDENHCYWPIHTSSVKINNMVEKLTEPDKKAWDLLKVSRILGTSDEYERGLEKMKQCLADGISTRSSGTSNKKRRRHDSRESSSDQSEIEEAESSETDDPTWKRKQSQSDSFVESSDSMSSGRKIHYKSKTSSSVNDFSSLKKSKKMRNEIQLTPNKDKNFTEYVTQMLNSIQKRLSLLEGSSCVSKADAVETDPAVLSDVMKIFPISTDEQMDNLEIFLSEEENTKLMISALKVIGGSGDDQLILNVLRRCISDRVGELYSFLGAKGKKAFKPLQFSSVIFHCVRHHSQTITEDKFASVVANWLRHAKQRRERQDLLLKYDPS